LEKYELDVFLPDYQSNGVNERAYLEQYNPSITSWSTATYCSPTSPPGDEEFHMAVKQGNNLKKIEIRIQVKQKTLKIPRDNQEPSFEGQKI
jgi:hypothetical protein